MNSSGLPGSQSLLDYALIDDTSANSVQSFVIDDEARYAAGSDHALLEVEITFSPSPKVTWKMQEALKYMLHDPKKLLKYSSSLEAAIVSTPLHLYREQSTEQMLQYLTETIHETARSELGLKQRKRQKGRRLPRSIIDMIRSKNSLASTIPSLDVGGRHRVEDEVESCKLMIDEQIGNWKLQKRTHLRSVSSYIISVDSERLIKMLTL